MPTTGAGARSARDPVAASANFQSAGNVIPRRGDFARDLRHGIRQLVHHPAFAAAAIGSLALGIGLNVTIFSIVNAVLLRSQPLDRPDRVVEIYSGLSKDYPQLTTSYPDFQDIVRGADALQGLAASSYVRGILSVAGKGTLVTGETITSDFFRVLGIPIEMGREFRDDENRTPNASPVTGQRPSKVLSIEDALRHCSELVPYFHDIRRESVAGPNP